MKKVSATLDFVPMEKKLLQTWEEEKLFDQIVAKNVGGKRFRFLDGPITANNRAGVHHMWGRVLKDLYIKYHALKGETCQYQNGFDAQGMWVEVNVERELGLNGKPEIVNYGIDKFTRKCMERVNYFANEITEQSKRLGQFMDWEHSYYTNTDENITSIWHFLKKCDEKGWIVKKNRPRVWCPRCGTSLSEHELSDAYSEVTHTAIFVKLPVVGKDFSIIAWTTTPWTLCANVAFAVSEDMDYVMVADNATGEKLVLGKFALSKIKDYTILKEFKGKELVGLEYETCFPELEFQKFPHKVVAWDEVEEGEGSGVVHIAPGCGESDFDLGQKLGLPAICPIDEQGVMLPNCGFIAGKKTTDVVEDVVNRLKADGKLLYSHKYKHSYAHCWRCKTDVVYKLVPTWYIRMDEIRPQLLKAIDDVDFRPDYAKKRMVDWLNNMGDWNISRARFYGLPLPFYVCPKCGKLHVIGSLKELRERAVNPEAIDAMPNLHRPWIDQVKVKCECGEELSRIPEVGDCWLDAGITPFSTKKFFTDKAYFDNNFPNEFVCEMIEQIKLWFYSTLVMSVVLTGKAPYERIITFQYVKDENGNPFHKSGGNSLEADIVADKTGAEAIRYLYAGANPVYDVRFGYPLTDEVHKKLLSFWNIYVFFNTYAVLDNPDIASHKPVFSDMCTIDKWLISRVNSFIASADENYKEYKVYNVVKEFEDLVDEISNFYIRANRKRFYNSGTTDQMDAYYSLYYALKKIITVMSPILPFLTDRIWRDLVCEIEPREVKSVHLSMYPQVGDIDAKLLAQVSKVRDIIYLAQKLRNEHKIKVKQPLQTLYLKCDSEYKKAVKSFESLVLDELNVKQIEFISKDEFNDEKLTLNFREAGAVLKGDVNKVKSLLENASSGVMSKMVAEYKAGNGVNVGEFKALSCDLFLLKVTPKEGFATAILDNNLVALDVNITPELMQEGVLREVIRQVQVARKDAGFDVENRIKLFVTSKDEETQNVIDKFVETIKKETLCVEFADGDSFMYETDSEITGASVHIKMSKLR
ncbi:MAG: isoleucine--tRNA ligase [Clostridia bacterium]|nr:isoleucine--tRNA ligase [Clostridia bacterium]